MAVHTIALPPSSSLHFQILGSSLFKVDLKTGLKKQLGRLDRVTQAKALEALQTLSKTAQLKCRLSRTGTVVGTGMVLLGVGQLIAPLSWALWILGMTFEGLGGGMIGFGLKNGGWNGVLPCLSQAYAELAEDAQQMLETLQPLDNSTRITFRSPLPRDPSKKRPATPHPDKHLYPSRSD